MELIVENLEGWVPGTNVYQDHTGQLYIIAVVNFDTAHHTEIYLGGVNVTPVMQSVSNDPDLYFNKRLDEITEDDFHKEIAYEHREYFAVDADDNPLNGLTPVYVLPAGTTHEDAIAHLISMRNNG